MKSSTLIYISLVLATCALFYSSQYIIGYSLSSSSSSSLSSHCKEQTHGDLSLTQLAYPIKEQGRTNSQKSEITKEERIKSRKVGFERKVRVTLEDEMEDLTYHIDYHGVTTHPTPTPKHPQAHDHGP